MNTLRCLAALLTILPALCSAVFPTLYMKPVVLQQFHAPTAIVAVPDGSGRLFVSDQPGRIYIIQDGMILPAPFLDISNTATDITHRKVLGLGTNYDERGLLGMAFHPGYANSASPGYRKFYLNYNKTYQAGIDPAPPVADHTPNCVTVIAEFQLSAANPNLADPLSERRLLRFTQPQSNHNGGGLAFGTDGMLYIASGDGGSSNDNNVGHTGGSGARPNNALGNSQDKTNYLGKILRIDPTDPDAGGPLTYTIPASNPFANDTTPTGLKKEIFAYGIRNPWGFAFDNRPGGTGRFFCADVGQGRVEEVNLIVSGCNYGWRYLEGAEMPSFSSGAASNPMAHPGGMLIGPIATYAHPGANVSDPANPGFLLPQLGLSITGGYVYRGSAIPELQGKYVFGDYGSTGGAPSGRFMGLEETAPLSGTFTLTQAIPIIGGNPTALRILCLGEDQAGEIYIGCKVSAGVQALDHNLPNGALYKFVPVPSTPPLVIEPARDTSLFSEPGGGGEELSNATGNLFTGLSSGNVRRALLAFDLSSIPAPTRFASAFLEINVNQVESTTVRNFNLFRVLEPWGEGTSFSPSGGAPATVGDATWLNRIFSPPASSQLWTTEGGDFDITSAASIAMSNTGSYSWQSVFMLQDVHSWLNSPAANHGWIIRSDEVNASTRKRIDSRESSAAVRPRLTLVHADPFQNWFAAHYPAHLFGQYIDLVGDNDGDGIVNQIEFAYGLNPHAFDAEDNFTTAIAPTAGSDTELTVTFRRDASATDLTYRLEISPDLATWTPIAQSAEGATSVGQNGGTVLSDNVLTGNIRLVTVKRTLTAADRERQFVRLAVDRAP